MSIVGTSRGLLAHWQVLVLVGRRESYILQAELWLCLAKTPLLSLSWGPDCTPSFLLEAGFSRAASLFSGWMGVSQCTQELSLAFSEKSRRRGSVFFQKGWRELVFWLCIQASLIKDTSTAPLQKLNCLGWPSLTAC